MKTHDHNGRPVSLLGFGLMRLPRPDPEKPDIDEQQALDMIDWAYQNGVTYFDTAWPYHGGLSEPFAARALGRYPRESYRLATKLPTWLIESPEDVDRYFEQQLERCGVQYFDYYLVHALGADSWPRVAAHDIFERLTRRRDRGQIGSLGFSFHGDVPLLREIAAAYPWDFGQLQINYLDWELQDAKTQYEILRGHGMPVVIMEPVRGGSLVSLSPPALEILREADPHHGPAAWALRYCAGLEGVLTVLSGMSTLSQVRENVATFQDFQPLGAAERAALDRAVTAYRQVGAIPCTGCRYCMDCPGGVDIPRVFGVYNDYKVRGSAPSFLGNYALMGEAKQAGACLVCGQCSPQCPQGIDIPARLAEIAAAAAALRAAEK